MVEALVVVQDLVNVTLGDLVQPVVTGLEIVGHTGGLVPSQGQGHVTGEDSIGHVLGRDIAEPFIPVTAASCRVGVGNRLIMAHFISIEGARGMHV